MPNSMEGDGSECWSRSSANSVLPFADDSYQPFVPDPLAAMCRSRSVTNSSLE